MFSTSPTTTLTCGFKVNTNSPKWHKSMMKILKKIKGGNFTMDVEEGMAYVTGQGDPNKLLKLMGSRKGQDAAMAFVKTGTHHHPQHHQLHPHHHPHHPHHHHHHQQDPSFYHNYQNSCYGYWPADMGYYSQAPAMQPYHHQYPYYGYF